MVRARPRDACAHKRCRTSFGMRRTAREPRCGYGLGCGMGIPRVAIRAQAPALRDDVSFRRLFRTDRAFRKARSRRVVVARLPSETGYIFAVGEPYRTLITDDGKNISDDPAFGRLRRRQCTADPA